MNRKSHSFRGQNKPTFQMCYLTVIESQVPVIVRVFRYLMLEEGWGKTKLNADCKGRNLRSRIPFSGWSKYKRARVLCVCVFYINRFLSIVPLILPPFRLPFGFSHRRTSNLGELRRTQTLPTSKSNIFQHLKHAIT